jgi:two-component system, NtrC family, nitrogen regulation sensor histidine kinase NtrY
MVDEFSAFARMPRPELKTESLNELVRQSVFLERNRFPDVRIELALPERPITLLCDSRQVSQALINVLKNAAEAVHGRDGSKDILPPGLITVSLREQEVDELDSRIEIVVEDNGKGLPQEDRDRLTEPYVTTRVKGTGLGLAIVKKIMEDHNGDLLLEDRAGGGARVSLVFNRVRPAREAGTIDAAVAVTNELRSSPAAKLHANG